MITTDQRGMVGSMNHVAEALTGWTEVEAAGRPLAEIRVGDVMAKHVHTCGQDEDITVAQKRMRKYQLRRLPITDATGYVVGLLSLNDLALEASRERGPGRHPLRAAEVAETLAEVSRHRGADQLVAAAE